MIIKIIFALFCGVLFSSCLKTRADLGDQEQSQVYGKKSASNQATNQAARPSQLVAKAQATVDERDELIRGFNGRIENLENQISKLEKEKAAAAADNSSAQKMQLLQDALAKMETQIQKLEAEAGAAAVASKPAVNPPMASSDSNTIKLSNPNKKGAAASAAASTGGAYELAQEHFGRSEWKKAILSYQKYVDENAKGKNIADAKYKIGVCFQELGMKDEAMAFYEEVIANYGKTESGKKAKIRLTKIKK